MNNNTFGFGAVFCGAAVVINLIWAVYAYNLKTTILEAACDRMALTAEFVPKQLKHVQYDEIIYVKPRAKE